MTSAPDWPDDADWDVDECEICGFDGLESHYHCANCWEDSSLHSGHYAFDATARTGRFTCERKPRP